MKQKVTIKFCSHCDKCKIKAMEIASSEGVESVAIEGDEKLVVIGNDVDATSITKKLRKKFCTANILTIEVVKDKATLDKEKKDAEEKKKKEEEEKEKKFREEVLKRHKECRCWIKALHGKPKECCSSSGEVDKCCPEKVCPPTYPYYPYYPTCPPSIPTQMTICSPAEDSLGGSCSIM